MALQLVAAGGLITGRHVGIALATGIFLNLHFMAAGAVKPSALYLLAQGALVLWMAEQSPTFTAKRALGIAGLTAGLLAVVGLPFVSTVGRALVIEDPAVMFVTGGALTVLACIRASASNTAARRDRWAHLNQ